MQLRGGKFKGWFPSTRLVSHVTNGLFLSPFEPGEKSSVIEHRGVVSGTVLLRVITGHVVVSGFGKIGWTFINGGARCSTVYADNVSMLCLQFVLLKEGGTIFLPYVFYCSISGSAFTTQVISISANYPIAGLHASPPTRRIPSVWDIWSHDLKSPNRG